MYDEFKSLEEKRKQVKYMELEKLKQFKEFINCYDIVGKAYKLCENNDYCYLRYDGIGTYDINECKDMIEKDGSIECHHIYGYVDIIHIPIIIYLDEWDEEEKQYNCESYYINSDIIKWY